MDRKVGVKYCGHCNPVVEGPLIVAEIQGLSDAFSFVRWDEPGVNALLILCGCRTGCASRPEFDGPVVTMAGDSLDGRQFSGEQLPKEILRQLLTVFGAE